MASWPMPEMRKNISIVLPPLESSVLSDNARIRKSPLPDSVEVSISRSRGSGTSSGSYPAPSSLTVNDSPLGFDSKTVITGDITQSDLPKGTANGLSDAERILKDIEGIKFIHLTDKDAVRHELVQKIIQAYDHDQKR